MATQDTGLDASLYARAPRVDVPNAITLAQKLVAAAPSKPPASVKKALAQLKKDHQALADKWAQRENVQPTLDGRPVDNAADNAWSRLCVRVEAYAELPADHYPLAARAIELNLRLFPDRLKFTQLEHTAQWAEMDKRIGLIRGGLQADLERVAGPEFVADVMRVHGPYGEMVGATRPKDEVPTPPALSAPLRALLKSVASYALQIVAWNDDTDGALYPAAAAALAPIDERRARRAATAATPAMPATQPSKPA